MRSVGIVEGSKEAEQVDGSGPRDDDADVPQRLPQNQRGGAARAWPKCRSVAGSLPSLVPPESSGPRRVQRRRTSGFRDPVVPHRVTSKDHSMALLRPSRKKSGLLPGILWG
jgi:hypothetical protein